MLQDEAISLDLKNELLRNIDPRLFNDKDFFTECEKDHNSLKNNQTKKNGWM